MPFSDNQILNWYTLVHTPTKLKPLLCTSCWLMRNFPRVLYLILTNQNLSWQDLLKSILESFPTRFFGLSELLLAPLRITSVNCKFSDQSESFLEHNDQWESSFAPYLNLTESSWHNCWPNRIFTRLNYWDRILKHLPTNQILPSTFCWPIKSFLAPSGRHAADIVHQIWPRH